VGLQKQLRPLTCVWVSGLNSDSHGENTMIRLRPDQLAALEDYSELSGRSVESLVAEALEDFIECCVESRTEALAARTAQA